ncbi:MAG TPA: hypothetical protein VHZ75_10280 [Solirubrobacteraceae bacterium]|jgi:hypothetical protein|nr:hypothetical protein [Solirubrobacteraceae bacterium]
MNDPLITKTFPLTGPINLAVRIGRGSLTVRTADALQAATVELAASPGAKGFADEFTVQLVGPTLTVAAPREGGLADIVSIWRQRSRDGVSVTVTVPTGTALKLVTSNAPIAVIGRCGGADVATGSGTIVLDHVDGDLLLRYGSGGSQVDRVAGSVILHAGSGDARFGVIEGSLKHGCGRGLLDVGEVHGSVRSRNGAGSARLAMVHGDVDVASGAGPLSVGLPAGTAAHVNATTGSGRVHSDLPVQARPAPATLKRISVRARTGSGDIELFRAS